MTHPPTAASRRRSQRPRRGAHTSRLGFTLIELLTVVAIIGILATLLLTAVSSAQKVSRQARCTSNLRQIALSLDMYLDDFSKRPTNLPVLVSSRYLPEPAALLCPSDKTGSWGSRVQLPAGLIPVVEEVSRGFAAATDQGTSATVPGMPYSYLHPLDWDDTSWNQLIATGGEAGIAVCQLHGLGRANPDAPSIYDFQGTVLRAQRDGAVVRRKHFWPQAPVVNRFLGSDASLAAPASADLGGATLTTGSSGTPWVLFSDKPAN